MAKSLTRDWVTYTFPVFDESKNKWLVKEQEGLKPNVRDIDTHLFDTEKEGTDFVLAKALGN